MEDLLYKEIGIQINTARKVRGLTQQELSELIHLTRASIANIERGSQKISLFTLYQIANALKVSPQSLLPDIESIFNPHYDNKTINKEEILSTLSSEELEVVKLLKENIFKRKTE